MGKNEILTILREYKNQYSRQYGITSLGVFGSVAREQATDTSDVDICITTETPDPFMLVHIKADIEQRVHRRVDLVRLREKMNPLLRARIEKEGIYV